MKDDMPTATVPDLPAFTVTVGSEARPDLAALCRPVYATARPVDPADPATWPLPDVLPLVRPDPVGIFPECAVLIRERPLVAFLTDAFTPGLDGRLATCDRIEYRSVAELEADGWRVN